jgi:hypothetical protein
MFIDKKNSYIDDTLKDEINRKNYSPIECITFVILSIKYYNEYEM